jgi:hypothetical protein
VPKHRLVQLITADLKASAQAASHFHILTASSVDDRLMSFSKPDLIAFITSLGSHAESAALLTPKNA